MTYQALRDAASLEEGVAVLKKVIPVWVPATVAVATCASIYVTYRTRFMIAKWRKQERQRLLHKYHSIQSAATSASPSPQRCDPTDSGKLDIVDPTVVSEDDLDEFHMALGLVQPRDDDLVELVDNMLLHQPIPEGWVLFRCTAGYIRFRQLNTEELAFFHSGAPDVEALVRNGVSARNQADMELQFGDMSRGVSTSGHGEYDQEAQPTEPNVDFSAPNPDEVVSEDEAKLFQKLLGFFVDKAKESAQIEAQIQESFRPSRVKRSTSRRTGAQLTPSMRVTVATASVPSHTVPPLRMDDVHASCEKSPSNSPHKGTGSVVALQSSSSFQGLPPKRPPTPRSSTASAVRMDRVPSSVQQSSPSAPRVPSFRAPPRTPSSASLSSSVVLA